MIISLLRHAVAVERGSGNFPNDDRPLTEEGRTKMMKAANGLLRCGPAPDLILTSPLHRARDTAVIVAKALGIPRLVVETPLLLPEASDSALWDEIRSRKIDEAIMLVGHEPQLSRLASALLCAPDLQLEFKKGSLCSIEVSSLPPRQAGTLLWLLTQRHLRRLA